MQTCLNLSTLATLVRSRPTAARCLIKRSKGNIFFLGDGIVGGADLYRVSCEQQLSHVCSVVLTWRWRGKGGPLDLSGGWSDSLPGDQSPLALSPKTISHCGLTV